MYIKIRQICQNYQVLISDVLLVDCHVAKSLKELSIQRDLATKTCLSF